MEQSFSVIEVFVKDASCCVELCTMRGSSGRGGFSSAFVLYTAGGGSKTMTQRCWDMVQRVS